MAASNSFGQYFRISTFGESHGPAIGVVVDGCPAGLEFSEVLVQEQMRRRRPGQSPWVSSRQEMDEVKILSGVFQGRTLGTPIAMIIENGDIRPEDYTEIKSSPRQGHADDLWGVKFGHQDHRGGGRSSGRETASRVMAGAVAEMFVQSVLNSAVEMVSYVVQVGPLQLSDQDVDLASEMSREQVDDFVARFPSPSQRVALEKLLIEAKAQGESYGARVELVLKGLPQGLGEPVFHKLKADLASAFMGVGACVGVEFGHGFSGVAIPGTLYHSIDTSTANSPYGGIRGGISTGETLRVRMAIKPTSSILDVAKKGRHDPCIAPRALPVFESMAWLVIADHLLAQRLSRLSPNI